VIHLGDITKIKGDAIPVVDCIINGSPCQTFSIAGLRTGLNGESGLFLEAVRVIKEMRECDKATGRANGFIRPRFMVWENPTGVFSCHKGEDFRTVLEETAKIADPNAVIPRPPKNKWTNAGCVMGDGWSIAWRVFDAQFWGVPQRRRRIALVADFGGQCAPEILFERKSSCGNITQSGETQQAITRNTKASINQSVENVKPSFCIAGNIIGRGDKAGGNGYGFQEDISYTLTATDHHAVYCYDARGNGNGDISSTITGDHENRITDYTTVVCMPYNSSVRRLTPLECERLQGYPDQYTDIDSWTDNRGRVHKCSDTARYKALGNSIALPSWTWLLSRLCKYLGDKPTMGSLFDGIGGFPLIWEHINGQGSCLWASEIDSFCIAVTKKHFKTE